MQLIYNTQLKLDRTFKQDTIHKTLKARPDKNALSDIGVVPEGATSVSPKIVQPMLLLRKEMDKSRLRRGLQKRSSVEDLQLVMKGNRPSKRSSLVMGMSASPVAPSLLAKKLELERQFNERDLKAKLSNRPSAFELYLANVLRGAVDDDGSV